MGLNSVVSGHPKSTGILRVDGLSIGPSGFEASHSCFMENMEDRNPERKLNISMHLKSRFLTCILN